MAKENYSISNVNYDKNGNISSLQRNGKFNASGFGPIDNLTYSYSGNRLTAVTDAISGNDNTGDFRANGSAAYTYYENGALKSDANKGVSLVMHNTFLDKVAKVTYGNGDWIEFTYDGSGALIKRENSNGDYWEYADKMIFKNGQPYSFAIPEGRAIFEAGQWKPEFEYRDIQDNLRVAFRAEGNRLVQTQVSTQDPWGLEIQGLSFSGSTPQNFKFQNQEKIDDFGLNLNWFKYRAFDPQIGRGWQVDKLAEKFPHNSVYAFSENKVVRHVELDGLEAVFIHGTWSDKSTWSKNFVDAIKVAVGRNSNDKAFFGNWSGANKASERRTAAKEIYNFLTSSNNPYANEKHATLISHSHGGNVAKVLNNLLASDDWKVDIINIETPQREDFQVKTLTDGKYLNRITHLVIVSSDHFSGQRFVDDYPF